MIVYLFRKKVTFLSIIAFALSIYPLNYANSAESLHEMQYPSDQKLQSLIEEARKLYEYKYRESERKASELFGINFAEYEGKLKSQINQLNLKISLIEKLQNPEEKKLRMRLLEKEYENSDILQYMQVYHYIQNEIAKDHLYVGKYLSMLEKVLEIVIQKEPFFRYVFFSNEFQKKRGLILTRVVWETKLYHHVSAVTQPLNMHTVFANKAKIPMLIRITPNSFLSLSFLRSILIHELNHVYMYGDPVFSDIKKFSGRATGHTRRPFTHYLKSLNPFNPSYQYHLIHEYYGLKTQLMFDEVVGENAFYKLDEKNRIIIKEMLDWVYSQLDKKNKIFVDANPTPPIFKTVQDFYFRKNVRKGH